MTRKNIFQNKISLGSNKDELQNSKSLTTNFNALQKRFFHLFIVELKLFIVSQDSKTRIWKNMLIKKWFGQHLISIIKLCETTLENNGTLNDDEDEILYGLGTGNC